MPRIAQVVEQLHTMNPQHHPKRIGAAATASLRIERLDPILQLLPGNQPLHLLQEDLPARPPLLRIVLQFRKSHLKLHGPLTAPRSFHTTKLHPSCSELPQWVKWVEDHFAGDGARDPWGNLYQYEIQEDSFAVISSGPDGIGKTEDDIRDVRVRNWRAKGKDKP